MGTVILGVAVVAIMAAVIGGLRIGRREYRQTLPSGDSPDGNGEFSGGKPSDQLPGVRRGGGTRL